MTEREEKFKVEEIHGRFNNAIEEKSAEDPMEEASRVLNDMKKLSIHGGLNNNNTEEEIAEDLMEEASRSLIDIKKLPIHGGFKNDFEEKTAENLHVQPSRSQNDVKIVPINGEFKIAEDRHEEASQSHHYDIQKIPINGGLENEIEEEIAEDVHKEALQSGNDINGGLKNNNEARIAEERQEEEGLRPDQKDMKKGRMNGSVQEFNCSVDEEKSLSEMDEIMRKYVNIFTRLDELLMESIRLMKKEQVDPADEEGDIGGIKEQNAKDQSNRVHVDDPSDSGLGTFVYQLEEESDSISVKFQELMSNNNL